MATPMASRSEQDGVGVARESDRAALLQTITLAFAADPVVRWVFPDAQVYLDVFPRFANAYGGGAFAQGTAFASGGHAGAALWLPPGSEPDEETMIAIMEESVAAGQMETVGAVFEEMERYHPDGDCWYLTLLGVDPSQQGRGHGSALLKRALQDCDAAGLPAYLEATCERNAALYARHGFEALGEVRAGDCPPLTPMLRQPR